MTHDYYEPLGSQYIFCARQHSYSGHGIITLMGECPGAPAPALAPHQHQHLSLSLELTPTTEEH
jgi:hypothetical protein